MHYATKGLLLEDHWISKEGFYTNLKILEISSERTSVQIDCLRFNEILEMVCIFFARKKALTLPTNFFPPCFCEWAIEEDWWWCQWVTARREGSKLCYMWRSFFATSRPSLFLLGGEMYNLLMLFLRSTYFDSEKKGEKKRHGGIQSYPVRLFSPCETARRIFC